MSGICILTMLVIDVRLDSWAGTFDADAGSEPGDPAAISKWIGGSGDVVGIRFGPEDARHDVPWAKRRPRPRLFGAHLRPLATRPDFPGRRGGRRGWWS